MTAALLADEKDANGTVVVSLTVNSTSTRTETRADVGPDGITPVRTFTYGAYLGNTGIYKNYLLKTYTDFLGNLTTLSYDADGYVSSIKDAKNNTTSIQRLNQGYPTGVITKITHPGDGSTIQYFYTDATGAYLDHMTDERNKTTIYRHTPGTMTTYEIDYPDNGVEKYTYNTFGEVVNHTMPSNTSIDGSATDWEKYSYDNDNGLLLTYTPPGTTSDPSPSPHPTRYHYDMNDHCDTITDPRGHVTTLYHNEIGQVTFVQHPDTDNSLIAYGYNADETLQLMNVQLNATDWAETDYTYDDYKRLLSVTSPTGHVTNYFYNRRGNAAGDLTHTDSNVERLVLPSPSSKVTKILYDADLRKTSVAVGFGTSDAAKTSYTYDQVGNLATMKDPRGATWTYNYDTRDRLINVIDPLAADRNSNGHTVDYTYDPANNKTSEERANNQIVSYDSYDEMNRLTQMTVQQGQTADAVTSYTWSNSGKMLTMVDPKVHTYTYTYDLLNRLVSLKYPLLNGANPTELYKYDIAGNVYQFTNRNGDVQTFTYDSRNRETNYSWSTGAPQPRTLVYDDASRVTACNTTSTPSTNINFVYNLDNTLKSQEEWSSYLGDNNTHRTVTYTYDEDQNRATKGLAGTTSHAYVYTARNQIQSITAGVNGASFVDYTYDKNGNTLTRIPNNSTSSSFVYDAVNRVTGIGHNFGGGETRVLSYSYDPVGNRQYEHRDNHLGNDDFGYDLNSQLTDFTRSGTQTTDTTSAFTFDASGNRSRLVKDAVTTNYTTNNLNEYATVSGVAAPTYDSNGNLLTYDDGAGTATFFYDSMNRLTQAVKGGTTEKFYYDGLNRQIARSITGGASVITVWDGWNVYAEFAPGGTTRTDLLVYGPGGDLVKSTVLGQFFYPDALGSTAHYADASGTLLESYTYDHYGTPVVYDPAGNQRTGGTMYGITRLFTGQQWHDATKIYDLRNRFLLPSLGRFLQPDPIGFAGDPANLYRYCGNNPGNESDPTGLSNKLDGAHSDGTSKFIPLGSHIPLPDGASVYSAFNFPSGYSSTNGWGSVSGPPGASASAAPVRRATDVNGYYSDGTPSFPITPLGKFVSGVGDFVGKVLNIPNDIVGIGLGVLGLPFGGEQWNIGHNAIEITGNRLVNLIAPAITVGNITNYRPGSFPWNTGDSYILPGINTGFHEQDHTLQGQHYGPLFLPAYVLGQIFKGAFPYVDPRTGLHVNPFEAGADIYAAGQGP